jgi:hypothetical protein
MLSIKEFVVTKLNGIIEVALESLALIGENIQKIADMFNMFGGPLVGLAVKACGPTSRRWPRRFATS